MKARKVLVTLELVTAIPIHGLRERAQWAGHLLPRGMLVQQVTATVQQAASVGKPARPRRKRWRRGV